MTRKRNKIQSQTLSPARTSPEHTQIEEIGSQQMELSPMIAAEVKKKKIEKNIGKIISEV